MKSKIKEYVGSDYYFLLDYLSGGYENYVKENLFKITHKKVYGVFRLKSQYKKSNNILQTVLKNCEDTLNYINN